MSRKGYPLVVYVTPWISENTEDALRAACKLRDIRVALLLSDSPSDLDPGIRKRLAAVLRIANAGDAEEIVRAIRALNERQGKATRIIGDAEEVQVAIARARERLNIKGMNVASVKRFRDKYLMKCLLAEQDIPCAKFSLVKTARAAAKFAAMVGFPLVVKPRDGARSQSIFKVADRDALEKAVATIVDRYKTEALLEEYIDGREYSCEAFCSDGAVIWHSFTEYLAPPLLAMNLPGFQWSALLPRRNIGKTFGGVLSVARKAIRILGMHTGVIHMEWFRKRDGNFVFSEIAARPPAAKIPSLLSIAHEFNFMETWLNLVASGRFNKPPRRKWAAGVLFLRGSDNSKVIQVSGLRRVLAEFHHLVAAKRIPWIGQASCGDYEGDGYIIVRDARTDRVRRALAQINGILRVKTSIPRLSPTSA
jgi:hypothetical protein